MSNPKRKVTDLLPSEAILISSDADLKVLEEFEKVGAMWLGVGFKATGFKPSISFPFQIVYEENKISWLYNSQSRKMPIYPATDFVPTDPERGLTIIKGDGSIITAQNQDGRVFDIEPIPTESDEVEVSDYWKTRCKLAEAIIEACPCDPDITTEQIEAWNNYHEFLKTRNTPNQ